MIRTRTSVLIGIAAVGAMVFAVNESAKSRAVPVGKTAVGVPANRVIFLTAIVPTGSTKTLAYDGGTNSLIVPSGKAFVVSDIRVTTNDLGNPSARTAISFDFGGRKCEVHFHGYDNYHENFAAGIVIPAVQNIEVTNQVFSTDSVEVQVMGYFVNGEGLAFKQVPFGS